MKARYRLELEQAHFITQVMSTRGQPVNKFGQGLEIYRNNILATAQQALSITFPTLLDQVGSNVMRHITELLIETSPPYQGDWGEWGETLPNLIKSIEVLKEYPFLADLARVDLAIHRSERTKNEVVDIDSFKLLAKVDLNKLVLQLSSSVKFFSCEYPVIEMRQVSLEHNDKSEMALQTKISSESLKQNVLVYRPDFKGELRELRTAELKWLTLLAKRISMGEALEMMNLNDFNFQEWIALAIEQRLVTSIVIKN